MTAKQRGLAATYAGRMYRVMEISLSLPDALDPPSKVDRASRLRIFEEKLDLVDIDH